MQGVSARLFNGFRPTLSAVKSQKARNSATGSTAASKPSFRRWMRQYGTQAGYSLLRNTERAFGGEKLAQKGIGGVIAKPEFRRSITRPNPSILRQKSHRTVFIRTESTPNPDSMKFMPDQPLLEPGQSIDFENAMAAARSPLAKMLFRNDCVQRVFIGSTFVTITKDEDMEWEQVKPLIFADMMEFLSSGEEILLGEVPVSDTTILPEDSEDVALIKTLIETRIRPSIQDDGGDLTYKGFIDGVVFLQLQGSCTSCPSSSVTLKNGIEKMLKHWSSSVISVVAVESEEEWERIASAQPGAAAATNSASPETASPTPSPSADTPSATSGPEEASFQSPSKPTLKLEEL